MQREDEISPRDGALIPSAGIEWSLIGLGAAILGFLVFVVALLGTRSSSEPTYEGLRPLSSQQSNTTEPALDIGSQTDSETR